MQYGLSLPTGAECGDPRFLVMLAERAEAVGWDGLFLEDYVCYGGDASTPTCNTWAVLAAVAARTDRIRLGTEVTPLTRRRPWNVAREAAAVDQLSGGRMILGIGLGDTGEAVGVDASFVRFGEEPDARTRGEMLDEALEIVAGRRSEDWEAEREHIRAVAETSADWWIEWVPPSERDAMVEAVERGPLRID